MEKTEPNHAHTFNFLTEIYDVMKCFENNPSKLGNKINELKMKFDTARSTLATLPGIDMSYTEQQEYYESLLAQYKKEKQYLESYKDICKFDISDLEKGPSESFLNSQTKQEEKPFDQIIEPEIDLASLDQSNIQPQFTEPIISINDDNNLMELDNFHVA